MRRRGREQALVVRIAADDSMQDDDVCRLDAVGVDGDVVEPAFGAPGEPRLVREPRGLVVVGRMTARG